MADNFVEFVFYTMGHRFVEYQRGFGFMAVAFDAYSEDGYRIAE
jgi:hypothetical protein